MTICTLRDEFPLTEMSFCAWLAQAVPGEALEYHRGFLLLDRDRRYGRFTTPDRITLINLADRALWAARRGLVHLVQRRCGRDCFAYVAIARPFAVPPGGSLSILLTEEIYL